MSCGTEKLPVKINHSEKPLEAGLVCWLWKGGDSGGVLHQGRTTRGGEVMTKELNLLHSKLALRQANSETILTTEEKHVPEMLDVRGQIFTKNKDVIDIHKAVRKVS